MEFSLPASSTAGPLPCQVQRKGVQRGQAPPGRDSSACLTLLLPSLAWDEWIPRGKSAMLAFFYIVFRQEMGKMGKEKGRSVGTYLPPPPLRTACWWALSCRWRAVLSGIGERVRERLLESGRTCRGQ